jgi:hypothetical protein
VFSAAISRTLPFSGWIALRRFKRLYCGSWLAA